MRRYSPIRRGAGFAIGFGIGSAILGIVTAATVGIWQASGRLHPVAKYAVRIIFVAAIAFGILVLLSEA